MQYRGAIVAYYTLAKRKPKKRSFSKRTMRFLAIVLIISCIVGFCIGWYVKRIRPVLLATAEANVRSHTTLAVNDAVLSVIGTNAQYSNIITIERNQNNDVVLMQANSSLINNLSRQTALLVQKKVSALQDVGVHIPIGTLSGIPFLTGRGSDISIEVTPIGTVTCSFSSTFVSAGINQTIHKIYMQVDSSVDIIIPAMQKTIDTSTSVLICETIIVGHIPDTYLNGTFFTNSQK